MLYQLSYLGAGKNRTARKPRWAVRGSNPRPPRCKRGALPTELTAPVAPWLEAMARREVWCPDRDLNPDDLRHTPLKRTRIPIPPPGQRCCVTATLVLVSRKGLEPIRPCGHWLLKPARLPIPPPRPVRSPVTTHSTARRNDSTSRRWVSGSSTRSGATPRRRGATRSSRARNRIGRR